MSIDRTAVSSAMSRRYSDAYVVARTIDGFGTTIKAIGIVIGALLALAALAAADRGGVFVAVIGVAVGGAIATALFLLGTLASAQGQILKATLDTAVNTSHFLTEQDRARIMSLPHAAGPSPARWQCRCGQRNAASSGACIDCGVQYGAA